MQIFVTSPDPAKCAERLWENPNRARKMITETQQILACCQKHFFGEVTIKKVDGTLFKTPKSRMNHPCVKWACEKKHHMKWLTLHLSFLFNLYRGDGFKNVNKNRVNLLLQVVPIDSPKSRIFLNFAKAKDKGLDFTHIDNVFEAYNLFLKAQGA